ncbi:Uncharacterized protein HSRCO_0734 [Halanaeroarchaeum sp. HSR-CO]|nr:Uncharacterized protein HSRCO_0734 [Halanaeroarchaeum sp. HSR-CO]
MVRIVKQFGDTIRIDIEESRRWRIDVKQYGGIELIASWNSDGKLDDVPLPVWLPDLLHRLGLQGVVVE